MVNIHEKIAKKFGITEFTRLPYSAGKKVNRNHLTELFAELGYNKGAEIGVRKGKYSEKLCKANPNLKLFCVDPWSPYAPGTKYYSKKLQDALYQKAVDRLSVYNVEIIRQASVEASKTFADEWLDFVFIDGNHKFDYVVMDIIHWSRKVKSGGIVSCHDYYHSSDYGVVEAVDGYLAAHNITPWYVTKETQPTVYWVKP